MSAVEVRDLHKLYRRYGRRKNFGTLKSALLGGRLLADLRPDATFEALKGVSFTLARGRTLGIVGRNGSGKSTLLKLIAGIGRPTSGTIGVEGRVSALIELGAGFHPEISGRENVAINGIMLGLTRREVAERFDAIVAFAELERFIDAPVKTYSSGMYMRLGFSVAIHVDPDVLLVDEVLAVGDETFQQRCNEKFADLRAAGKTIVVVSHALGVVRTMCDQAAWLEHGIVKDIGTPGRLIDEYIEVMHPERVDVQDEETGEPAGTRWGSGEARIERVELLGRDGQPTRQVHMGDAVTFRFHYVADQPIPKPVFGFGLHRLDGVHVSGINSRETCVPDEIAGRGYVDFRTTRLPVLAGTYDVTAALMDFPNLHVWDHRNKLFRFDIEPGLPREAEGVIALEGSWSMGSTPP